MTYKIRALQRNATAFFNSLPYKVSPDSLHRYKIEGGGFVTKEIIELKFGVKVNEFYKMLKAAGFLCSKIEVVAVTNTKIECLGILFASDKASYIKGMRKIKRFTDRLLTQFDNCTVYEPKYIHSRFKKKVSLENNLHKFNFSKKIGTYH